jgi:hypothetical protein
LFRKLATAVSSGLIIAALSASATAFAATDPGASACQPAAGQLTAFIAQNGTDILGLTLGEIISSMAPINEANQDSLFACS